MFPVFLFGLTAAVADPNTPNSSTSSTTTNLSSDAEYVIIVHEEVADNPISERSLKRIISRQQCCWSGGLEVSLILPQNNSDSTIWFISEMTGLDPEVYHRYLMERCYRIGCTPVIGTEDLDTAQDVASRTPGSLTIAHRDLIPEGMQVLEVTE